MDEDVEDESVAGFGVEVEVMVAMAAVLLLGISS
jgi:hypothetical protein